MNTIVYRAGRAAMCCWCEVFLCGEDRGHLAAVAELALNEITRVERMLSRFDPASEVFRLNHAAVGVPMRVSPELFVILLDCRAWWERTEHAFDITVQPPSCEEAAGRLSTPLASAERWNAIHFDAPPSTVTRTVDAITFDFGGYGKGYAIDRALAITQQHGITAACLHAGTSSVAASGSPPDTAGWPIAIRHPDEETQAAAEWHLSHAGMSTSAVPSVLSAGLPTPHSPLTEGLFLDGNAVSHNRGDLRSDAGAGSGDPRTTVRHDIIDPIRHAAITHPASCTVMAPTAAIAEVWSTALLVHGERLALEKDVVRVLCQRFVDEKWITSSPQIDP